MGFGWWILCGICLLSFTYRLAFSVIHFLHLIVRVYFVFRPASISSSSSFLLDIDAVFFST